MIPSAQFGAEEGLRSQRPCSVLSERCPTAHPTSQGARPGKGVDPYAWANAADIPWVFDRHPGRVFIFEYIGRGPEEREIWLIFDDRTCRFGGEEFIQGGGLHRLSLPSPWSCSRERIGW